VFLIFTAQMIFSTCLVGLCAHSPTLMQAQADNFYLFWIAIGGYMFRDICLLTRRELSRREPTNYLILLAATLSQGYILSMSCRTYTPECVFMVFLVATSAFVGMTIYGFVSRRDIGVKGSIGAAVTAAGLALALVFTQFEKSEIFYMSFCCLFIFIAIVFVAIDTQMILKEKRYGIT
jgi:FtsH-binding integral membrane protein